MDKDVGERKYLNQSLAIFELSKDFLRVERKLFEGFDMIVDQGIDLYRQDFNMDPLAWWRQYDAPDRQGISAYLANRNGGRQAPHVGRWPGILEEAAS